MTVVIVYDIERNAARRRVSALLQVQLARVQKSVFEGRLDVARANRLFDAVLVELEDQDRARMYVINAGGLARCRSSGGTPLPHDGAYWLV
jgi:CRISPR-associated endonuclease Cas2